MSRRRAFFAALLSFCVACTTTCEDNTEAPQLGDCAAPLLRDDEGGVLVLRGANVSAEAKWNAQRLPPFGAHQLTHLRDDLGMNAIRLLVFWEAIEPYPALYDEDYLQSVAELVQEAKRLGLHVIVDMHQDVYGRGFGQAGAPRWSCDEELYATFEEREPWFLGYLQREVGACFDRLYRHGETRAAFYGAWATLAERLAPTGGVLAYDLLNEPFWGSTSAREFERAVLTDFYRELVDVLRDVDREPFIVVEPAPSTNVGLHSELPQIEREHMLYGPHFYPPAVELGTGYDGNRDALREQLKVLCADAARLEAPLVIGELGVRRNVQGARDYVRDIYGVLDASGVGAFYWNLERGGETSYGLLRRNGTPAWTSHVTARPYPRRTAGTPLGWSWDEPEGVFAARWQEDGSASGETLIALPRLAFPSGVAITLDGGGPHELRGSVLRIPQQGGLRRLVVRRREPGPPAATTSAVRTPDAGAPPRTDGGATSSQTVADEITGQTAEQTPL